MAKPTKRKYTICAQMTLDLSVDIMAASLEDAVQQAKEMKEDEFVQAKGDWNDTKDFRIAGVWSL